MDASRSDEMKISMKTTTIICGIPFFLLIAPINAEAQAPLSLSGNSFEIAITDGTYPLASTSYALFLPASSGNTYQVVGIDDLENSSGTYSYSVSRATGTADLDDSIGGAAVLNAVFSTSSPAAGIAAGGQWQVDGDTWQNSGSTASRLSVGSHTVSFNSVSGWRIPTNQTVSVSVNSTVKANGTYVAILNPFAASISGLYNTGENDDGTLAALGMADSHYALVSVPSGEAGTAWVVPPFPSAWCAGTTSANWLSPTLGGAGGIGYSADTGLYDYRLVFSMVDPLGHPLQPTTATITGNWAADDEATLLLNGTPVATNNTGFARLYSFEVNSGFRAGTNTLDFVVINAGTAPKPSGMLVSDLSGTAVLIIGSLQVKITPVGAINAGARWQVDDGAWQKSGATVSGLSVGNHTVSFTSVSGWMTPASQTVTVNEDSTATASGTYVSIGSLQVTISPTAAINGGAQWQVDSGTLQNSGATVSNLSVGKHTVSFQGIDYWTAPSNQTVSIKAKAVAKDTGTYTFNAQGIYNGLFAQPDGTNVETSGMLSGLTVKASGTYTGKLLIGDSTNAISGWFNASGQATNNIKRAAKQGGPLTLVMQVNWNNSPLTITGTVSGTNGGDWTANLRTELAATGSKSAEYTAQLLPAGTPPGYGYLTITNDKGAVKLIGALADGASFSQAAPVSGDGDLPVYGNLYSSKGLLLGWIALESGSPAGSLTWIIEASRCSARYTNGFTNLLLLQGSLWTNPFPHTPAIDLPSGQLGISGGNLLSNLTFNVAVTNNDTLVKLGKTPANSLTGSINAKTGLLTITFGNGAGKATTTGTGAALQNATNAGGFFLGKTNAGIFLLQP